MKDVRFCIAIDIESRRNQPLPMPAFLIDSSNAVGFFVDEPSFCLKRRNSRID